MIMYLQCIARLRTETYLKHQLYHRPKLSTWHSILEVYPDCSSVCENPACDQRHHNLSFESKARVALEITFCVLHHRNMSSKMETGIFIFELVMICYVSDEISEVNERETGNARDDVSRCSKITKFATVRNVLFSFRFTLLQRSPSV